MPGLAHGTALSAVGIPCDVGGRPAHDSRPSTPVTQERRNLALDCGAMGRHANAKEYPFAACRVSGNEKAGTLVSDMKNQAEATWYETVLSCGASEK